MALTRLGKVWPQRLAPVAWRAGQGVRDGVCDNQNMIRQPCLETPQDFLGIPIPLMTMICFPYDRPYWRSDIRRLAEE